MRELKFRVWDGKNMYMLAGIDWEGYESNRIESMRLSPLKAGEELIPTEVEPNEMEILQFTGLQDKNGIDIYEGDILRYVPGYFESEGGQIENTIDTVIFDTSGFCWNSDELWEMNDYVEIIGNQFQNPELLIQE